MKQLPGESKRRTVQGLVAIGVAALLMAPSEVSARRTRSAGGRKVVGESSRSYRSHRPPFTIHGALRDRPSPARSAVERVQTKVASSVVRDAEREGHSLNLQASRFARRDAGGRVRGAVEQIRLGRRSRGAFALRIRTRKYARAVGSRETEPVIELVVDGEGLSSAELAQVASSLS